MKKGVVLSLVFLIFACAGSRNSELKIEERISELKLAIKMDQNDPAGYISLGNVYQEAHQFDKALEAYDQALKLHPGLNEALVQKGMALWYKGDTTRAFGQFKSVLYSPQADAYAARIARFVGCPHPLKKVSDGKGSNAFPSPSPVGNKILFQSNRDGNWEIYLMQSDGEILKRLTHNKARDENPVFAPDARTFAFTSTRDDTVHIRLENLVREIYLGHTDQSDVKRLTENTIDDWSPVFSDDSQRILYLAELEANSKGGKKGNAIMQLNLDTGEKQVLVEDGGVKSLGGYEKGAKRIYFSDKQGGTFKCYSMNLSKRKKTLLEDAGIDCINPKLSHDGKWLTFFTKEKDNFDIYLFSLDSLKLQRLTLHPALDSNPVFSADDSKIYFHSNRDGTYQIYSIDLTKSTEPEEIIKRMNGFLKH